MALGAHTSTHRQAAAPGKDLPGGGGGQAATGRLFQQQGRQAFPCTGARPGRAHARVNPGPGKWSPSASPSLNSGIGVKGYLDGKEASMLTFSHLQQRSACLRNMALGVPFREQAAWHRGYHSGNRPPALWHWEGMV